MIITQGFDRAIFDKELDLDLDSFNLNCPSENEREMIRDLMSRIKNPLTKKWVYIELDGIKYAYEIDNSEPFHISEIAEFIAHNHNDYDYEIEKMVRKVRWFVVDLTKDRYYGNLK